MIIPCIDLMGGKVVQLIQGRDKALEEDSALAALERFAGFREIQVIDLDAAMDRGTNDQIVALLASRAVTRVGGGVRSIDRARALVDQGAHRVIVGTSVFDDSGIRKDYLESLVNAIGRDRLIIALDSKNGRIVVRGWSEATDLKAEDVIQSLEPYCSGFLCTYVDKEGMLQGTDLDWFRRLRAATSNEITAAGGVTTIEDIQSLREMNVNAAVGMAIYTGRLDIDQLRLLS